MTLSKIIRPKFLAILLHCAATSHCVCNRWLAGCLVWLVNWTSKEPIEINILCHPESRLRRCLSCLSLCLSVCLSPCPSVCLFPANRNATGNATQIKMWTCVCQRQSHQVVQTGHSFVVEFSSVQFVWVKFLCLSDHIHSMHSIHITYIESVFCLWRSNSL